MLDFLPDRWKIEITKRDNKYWVCLFDDSNIPIPSGQYKGELTVKSAIAYARAVYKGWLAEQARINNP